MGGAEAGGLGGGRFDVDLRLLGFIAEAFHPSGRRRLGVRFILWGPMVACRQRVRLILAVVGWGLSGEKGFVGIREKGNARGGATEQRSPSAL
ncbi:hypothetical protein R1sor_026965 [Riccia sorocarpa]|uniref:Uncharacterized protein n=1 Tax=Riccia sorocarpa TaxID=122646 RepID=A0ABD3GFS3_9MARC